MQGCQSGIFGGSVGGWLPSGLPRQVIGEGTRPQTDIKEFSIFCFILENIKKIKIKS